MQTAQEAARGVAELREELANLSALTEAAAEGGGSMPASPALTELVKDVGKVVGLIPGNLWAGGGGALATQQQVAELREWLPVALARKYDSEQGATLEQAIIDTRNGAADMATLRAVEDAVHDVDERLRKCEAHLASGTRPAARPGPPVGAVLGKVLALQQMVTEIGKGREYKAENKGGNGRTQYTFRGIDDAMDAVGNAARQVGIVGPSATIVDRQYSTTPVGDRVWITVSITARYTFTDPTDGSTWSTEGVGMGRDLGDKADSKALAGAFKYALFHGLCIPIRGMNVDAETEDPRIEREHRQDAGRTYGSGRPDDGLPAEWIAGAERQERQAGEALDRPEQPAKRDDRSPEQLAHDALRAARKAASVTDFNPIFTWAEKHRLLTIHVDGVPLGQHLTAARRLLPGGVQ